METSPPKVYNTLCLRFAPHDTPETAVPYELRNYYTRDVWGSRVPAVIRKASRYYKQNLEYSWLLLFIASSIAVPIAIYYVCVDRLPLSQAEQLAITSGGYRWWSAGFDRFWKARLTSFSSWFAIALVFYGPILLWKRAGRSSVNKMLQKWENEDQAARPSSSEIPHWHLGYIGIFGSTIRLNITYQLIAPLSLYQPGANIPSFLVNAPVDHAASYYFSQSLRPPLSANPYSRSTWQDSNPPRSARGVPLYNELDEKAPAYLGPPRTMPGPPRDEEKLENIPV